MVGYRMGIEPRGQPVGRWLPAVCLVVLAGRAAADTRSAAPLVAPPREAIELLLSAEQAVAEQRWGEAIRSIELLRQTAGLDAFLEAERDGVQHTLRWRLEQLIAELPEAGAEQFDAWFGGAPRQRLTEATAAADRLALAEAARRHWGTRAGYDAILLAGCAALDRGEPWEALAWWRWLERWPGAAARYEPAWTLYETAAWLMLERPEQARRRFDHLERRGGAAIRLGDEVFGREDGEALFARLAQSTPAGNPEPPEAWPVGEGGKALEDAMPGSGLPLAWRADAVPSAAALEENGQPPLEHLLVDDLLLCRTPDGLVALELHTGRRRWQYGRAADRPVSVVRRRLQQGPVARPISTDGEQLFLVEDSARGLAGRLVHTASVQPSYHRLSALSLGGEGKLSWSTEMPGRAADPQLSGAVFLGPPLPLAGRLYILAEVRGDTVLCVLNTQCGELLWQAPLASPHEPVAADLRRRGATLSAVYGEGVVVCPTGTGGVAAFDPYTQQTLWAGRHRAGASDPAGEAAPADSHVTWRDVAPLVRDGHIVMAALPASDLLCHDLESGRLLWQVRPDRGHYVAGLHGRNVLVVGADSLQAWDLKTGRPAWESGPIILPEPMRPAGRGFVAGHDYYLPTTGAGVVRIDLARGAIAGTLDVEGPLGDLVGARGRLVSVSPHEVRAFDLPRAP